MRAWSGFCAVVSGLGRADVGHGVRASCRKNACISPGPASCANGGNDLILVKGLTQEHSQHPVAQYLGASYARPQ